MAAAAAMEADAETQQHLYNTKLLDSMLSRISPSVMKVYRQYHADWQAEQEREAVERDADAARFITDAANQRQHTRKEPMSEEWELLRAFNWKALHAISLALPFVLCGRRTMNESTWVRVNDVAEAAIVAFLTPIRFNTTGVYRDALFCVIMQTHAYYLAECPIAPAFNFRAFFEGAVALLDAQQPITDEQAATINDVAAELVGRGLTVPENSNLTEKADLWSVPGWRYVDTLGSMCATTFHVITPVKAPCEEEGREQYVLTFEGREALQALVYHTKASQLRFECRKELVHCNEDDVLGECLPGALEKCTAWLLEKCRICDGDAYAGAVNDLVLKMRVRICARNTVRAIVFVVCIPSPTAPMSVDRTTSYVAQTLPVHWRDA